MREKFSPKTNALEYLAQFELTSLMLGQVYA